MAIVLMESIVGPFRHPPLMSTTELAAVLEAAGAYKGKSTLRSAIPRVRERVASPQESHLRLRIVASGLPEPRVAAPVHLPGHPDPIHPDLSDEDAMIAIEYDGSGHWDQEQRAYDARRTLPSVQQAGSFSRSRKERRCPGGSTILTVTSENDAEWHAERSSGDSEPAPARVAPIS
ncbi:hypothetical protein GCM10009755_22060 [Brevibacterium samyangense]|uniref:DUF559 domain-containing protein n=2 Tax=Brevibacterium samyangense TaxID=366888 RepID=A0ABN2TI81_9MICO